MPKLGKVLKGALSDVFDALGETLKSGEIDGGAALNLSANSLTLVAVHYQRPQQSGERPKKLEAAAKTSRLPRHQMECGRTRGCEVPHDERAGPGEEKRDLASYSVSKWKLRSAWARKRSMSPSVRTTSKRCRRRSTPRPAKRARSCRLSNCDLDHADHGNGSCSSRGGGDEWRSCRRFQIT